MNGNDLAESKTVGQRCQAEEIIALAIESCCSIHLQTINPNCYDNRRQAKQPRLEPRGPYPAEETTSRAPLIPLFKTPGPGNNWQ